MRYSLERNRIVSFGFLCRSFVETFEYDFPTKNSMSEVSKAKRTTAKRVFTRTEKALIQALDTDALEETIQRRFEEFRRQWDKVQEAHDSYIEFLEEYSEEAIAKEDERRGFQQIL